MTMNPNVKMALIVGATIVGMNFVYDYAILPTTQKIKSKIRKRRYIKKIEKFLPKRQKKK
jgi:hypothetical protein